MLGRLFLILVALPALARAQCPMDVPNATLVGRPISDLIPEFNPGLLTILDVNRLCFSRGSPAGSFSATRLSLLFRYSGTENAIHTSYNCGGVTWRYDNINFPAPAILPADQHITANLTIEGCTGCSDMSTTDFGSPTGCMIASPCVAGTCLNGGTCSRTGLTTSTCACAGSWSGSNCEACGLSCQNGGTLDGASCSCTCDGGYNGPQCQNAPTSSPAPSGSGLSPGAIVGIVIACLVFLALIIGIIVIIVVIVTYCKSREQQQV